MIGAEQDEDAGHGQRLIADHARVAERGRRSRARAPGRPVPPPRRVRRASAPASPRRWSRSCRHREEKAWASGRVANIADSSMRWVEGDGDQAPRWSARFDRRVCAGGLSGGGASLGATPCSRRQSARVRAQHGRLGSRHAERTGVAIGVEPGTHRHAHEAGEGAQEVVRPCAALPDVRRGGA